METNQPTPPPSAPSDPNDVRDFLRSDAPPGSVEFDLPADVAEDMRANATPEDSEPPPERVDVPMSPIYDAEQSSVANILYWTMQLPNIGTVTVSDYEKTLYLKSVNNDAPVVFEITLPTGSDKLTVEIKSRSVFEERATFAALDIAAYERKDIHDPGAFATRSQQLCAAVQIISINGKALPELNLKQAGSSIREASKLIEAHTNHVIESMSGPRWGAVLTALRIFEVKVNLCNTNVNNETFWVPAS